jgi:hypothetical protein
MTVLPVGPYKVIKTAGGGEMPWYMMPFDRDGICTGPETRKHLMAAVAKEAFTDIYLFSHGWNNDWKDATDRYQSFIDGYSKLRAARHVLRCGSLEWGVVRPPLATFRSPVLYPLCGPAGWRASLPDAPPPVRSRG